MTDIITIDPSLNCTAMVVNDKKIIITTESYANTKSGLNKWFDKCKDYIQYEILPDITYSKDYSAAEIEKLKRFKTISSLVFRHIIKNSRKDVKIYIEGYSYSSMTGPLIDLVTLSTLIREQCITLTDNVKIVSPKTLKMMTAEWAYDPIQVKKKLEYRNHDGVSGGKFTKTEMCKALIECKYTCDWIEFLRENKEEILKNKKIPKPIEDINDAKIMFEIFKDK
jgi:hypothetical protein